MPPKKAVKIRGREIEEQEIIYEFEYKNGDTRKRSLTHLDKAQIELVQKYEINQLQGKQENKSESPTRKTRLLKKQKKIKQLKSKERKLSKESKDSKKNHKIKANKPEEQKKGLKRGRKKKIDLIENQQSKRKQSDPIEISDECKNRTEIEQEDSQEIQLNETLIKKQEKAIPKNKLKQKTQSQQKRKSDQSLIEFDELEQTQKEEQKKMKTAKMAPPRQINLSSSSESEQEEEQKCETKKSPLKVSTSSSKNLKESQCEILQYKTDKKSKEIKFLAKFANQKEEAWITCDELKSKSPIALCNFLMMHLKWKI